MLPISFIPSTVPPFPGATDRVCVTIGDCNEDEWEKVDASDEDSGIASTDSAKQSPVADSVEDPAAAAQPADKPKVAGLLHHSSATHRSS